MKKILLIIIAIVIAVVVFLPKYIGMQFASGLQNTVDTVNTQTVYNVSVVELNSGWMSTKAILNVGFKMPDFEGMDSVSSDISANIEVNATHGPILTSGDAVIGLLHTVAVSQNSSLPDSIVLATTDSPILKVDATTDLFGTTDFSNDIVGLTYTDPESGMMLSFSGLTSRGSISDDSYQVSGNAQSITVGSDEMQVAAINDIVIEGGADAGMMQMMTQGLYNSNASFSIADMTFTNMFDGSQTTVSDTKMYLETTLDEATDMGDLIIKTTMAQFDAVDMNISDLLITLDIKNLQAKFMRAYQEFTASSMDYATDPEAMQNALQQFLNDHLLEQLQQNPEYNISALSGKVDGGEFNGQVLTKLVNITALPDTMEDPAFWVEHAEVDTQLSFQKAAAEFFAEQFVKSQVAANPQFLSMSEEEQAQMLTQQTQATLAALVQQGMLVADGEDYKFTFTMKDAAAQLNGNPMPLPL